MYSTMTWLVGKLHWENTKQHNLELKFVCDHCCWDRQLSPWQGVCDLHGAKVVAAANKQPKLVVVDAAQDSATPTFTAQVELKLAEKSLVGRQLSQGRSRRRQTQRQCNQHTALQTNWRLTSE